MTLPSSLPRALGPFLAALCVAALASCSASVSARDAHLKEAELEAALMDQITEEVGRSPDDVDCPGDLPGEVGATITCELSAGPDRLDVEVEVTKVDGTDLRYVFEVGQVKESPGTDPSTA